MMTGREKGGRLAEQVWRARKVLRGVDVTLCRDYVMALLFLKYISDARVPLTIPAVQCVDRDGSMPAVSFPATFSSLYMRRNHPYIGGLINQVLAALETANPDKLGGVFRSTDFSSEVVLGPVARRNERLRELLDMYAALDLRPEAFGAPRIMGDAFERLLMKFHAATGKQTDAFHTAAPVSELLVRLTAPQKGERIYDPVCGSGGMLLRAARAADASGGMLFGQEKDERIRAICRMRMLVNGMHGAHIARADTLRCPMVVPGTNTLPLFDVIVADPLFCCHDWDRYVAAADRHGRYYRGVPPAGKWDWAIASHVLASMGGNRSRAAVLVSHGALFREGPEARIREEVIRENLLDAVIGLPAEAFSGRGVPSAVLLFRKSRQDAGRESVVFVDAGIETKMTGRRCGFRMGDVAKIVTAVLDRRAVPGYAHVAEPADIAANHYSFNLPLYLDPVHRVQTPDVRILKQEINALETELRMLGSEIDRRLTALADDAS